MGVIYNDRNAKLTASATAHCPDVDSTNGPAGHGLPDLDGKLCRDERRVRAVLHPQARTILCCGQRTAERRASGD